MLNHDMQMLPGLRKLQEELERLRAPDLRFSEQIERLMKPQLLAEERFRKMLEPQIALQDAFKRFIEPAQLPQVHGLEKLIAQLQPSISHTLTSEWKRFEQIQESLRPTTALQRLLEEALRPSKILEEQIARSLGSLNDLVARYPLSSIAFDETGSASVGGEVVATESLQQAVQELQTNASKSGDFIDQLLGQVAKLKPAIGALLLYILLPYIISIIANLTTPLYEPLWKDLATASGAGARSEVRETARERFIPGELRTHRFVTAKALAVRQTGRQRSPMIITLRFGKTVKLLSKEKHWSHIEYLDDESNTIQQGWVLSRYLAKFE